jgi:hypothetical protein
MPLLGYESSCILSHRDGIRHRSIELRAYRLWEAAGRPEGTRADGQAWAEHFWRYAEVLFDIDGDAPNDDR